MTPDELREARRSLGLSQRGLAERLAVPYATLARWERATHKIQHPTILRLALERLATKEEE